MAKRWTKIEEDYLVEERAEGVSLLSIALVLGRSYDAVVKRSELLRKPKEERLEDEHAHGIPKIARPAN